MAQGIRILAFGQALAGRAQGERARSASAPIGSGRYGRSSLCATRSTTWPAWTAYGSRESASSSSRAPTPTRSGAIWPEPRTPRTGDALWPASPRRTSPCAMAVAGLKGQGDPCGPKPASKGASSMCSARREGAPRRARRPRRESTRTRSRGISRASKRP